MIIRAIKTEEDYNQALKRLEKIFHAPVGSKEGDEAEILSILIEKDEENIIRLPLRIQLKQLSLEWNNWK
jgi:HTH-type transcriptional regulator / antitoxin HigA